MNNCTPSRRSCYHPTTPSLLLIVSIITLGAPRPTLAAGGTATKLRDLIIVHAVTSPQSKEYIQATAGCRAGVRLFAATNDTVYESNPTGEFWTYYPDEHDITLNGLQPSDSRAALAPWLAFNYYGLSFKWMLVSADQTAFLPSAVLSMVKHLDPEVPYLLTDTPHWSLESSRTTGPLLTHPPPRHTPTCPPCSTTQCGCNSTILCLQPEHNALFEPNCSIPQPVHGVAIVHPTLQSGMLMSLGLLRALPYKDLRMCIWETPNAGAGAVSALAQCLLRFGFATTTLPPNAGAAGAHPAPMVGVDQDHHVVDHEPVFDARPGEHAALLQCLQKLRKRPKDTECLDRMSSTVSVHVGGGRYEDDGEAIGFLRQLCRAHAVLHARGGVHEEM